MRVIVNADDYGYDERTTMAIAEALHDGAITQATLMCNMPSSDFAVELAKERGFADRIGLHLNMTEGYPLTEPIRQRTTFCNEDGSFRCHLSSSWIRYSPEDHASLSLEIEAQIRKYIGYDLPLMHCDGHHHCHTRLPVLYVLLPLLKTYRFRSMRMPYTMYLHSRLALRGRLYFAWFNYLLRGTGLKLTREFGGYTNYLACRHALCRDALMELMVHPRYDQRGVVIDFDGTMDEIMETIRRDGGRLITYDDL